MRKLPTFEEDLKERLKDPEFKKAWEDSEPEYLSQRELAKKMGTSQAAIARVEGMSANPSLSFLKRLASALGTKLQISL
ncbi:MAG: Helix-turn-helix domain protein [Candidatus Gottesmanbacteria bacterium GW2011_GWC2_39_8]|uniref:Helix-turn-helix domain protein n=1 Tax=Candidatus Gottesmanbacteria bacterium GW2011_GWC2_39_8 TaxID=1618450 RepID=A0A0G0SDU8_9BACT|nr:MAG: Helix-turn-helix domain protein [Candidatus Gottesmanbacteria bacterium GW2011_GWC2_39_8]